MSDFKTTSLHTSTLDPYKRVRYSTGLVLGLDEFLQEEHYLLERHYLHNRSLHGYGTLCGLNVSAREGAQGPEVVVEAGLAVDSQGREIRVPLAQCAPLNAWLARHAKEVASHFGSPALSGSPPALSPYVVLCYRECETDTVPIPSEPCRSLEDSSVPSRIADDFELALRLTRPVQVEEDTLRQFGELLRRIEVSDVPGDFLTREELEQLVRGLTEIGSPPVLPPEGSPALPLRLQPHQAAEFLRAAFRVWVTEVRPQLLPGGRNCAAGPPEEACILLAQLTVPIAEVGENLQVVGEVTIDEADRPYLLQTRLLQEWLLHNLRASGVTVHRELDGLLEDDHPQYLLVDPVTRALVSDLNADGNRVTDLAQGANPGDAVPFEQAIKVNDTAGGDVAGTYPDPQVAALQGRAVANVNPNANDVLTWSGTQWEPRPAIAGTTEHGALSGLGDDDHPHYLLVNPATRALVTDLDAAGNRMINLATGTVAGDAVPFQQAVKVNDAAGGDLADSYPDPRVAALQGRTVANISPNTNTVLTWDGAQWTPRLVPVLEQGLTRIVALSWRHRASTTLQFILDGNPVFGLVVSFSRPVQVQPGSLDVDTFQLFVERSEGPGLVNLLRLVPTAIVPVETLLVSDLITEAKTVSSPAPGAALLISAQSRNLLREFTGRLFIVIKGDFVLDETKRAIDAEHVRGQLPSGDRPTGSSFGIQGGRFESWVQFGPGGEPDGGSLDLNRATIADLATLPNIDSELARRILILRNSLGGKFTAVDQLLDVPGMTAAVFNAIRDRLVIL